MNKAVLFDLDGTVLDTIGDIAGALNSALSRFGYPVHSVESVRGFLGNGSYLLIRRALPKEAPESEILPVRAEYLKEYSKATSVKTSAYPQMAELLRELHSMGIGTAVITNKDDTHARELIGRFFGETVDICRGVRADNEKKPDTKITLSVLSRLGVKPQNAVFVGDGLADFETAKNSNIPYIPVGYGYTDPELLREKSGSTPVMSVAELRNEILKFIQEENHGTY